MEERHFWFFVRIACCAVLLPLGQCVPTLSPVVLEELEAVTARVVVHSSPCSATCGVGTRTEELCLLGKSGEHQDCQEQRVECLLTWQCGLATFTVEVGGSLDLDCLEAVMEAMGHFRFIFSWRYARGIITTDDSLFGRLRVSQLDRVLLNPVREKDAGTYRCDVQDTSLRMVKRVYFGVRVLPAGLLHLDFADATIGTEGTAPNGTAGTDSVPLYPHSTLLKIVTYSLSISAGVAVLTFLVLYCLFSGNNRLASAVPYSKSAQNVHCVTLPGKICDVSTRPCQSVDV